MKRLARVINGVEEGVISLLLVAMTLLVFVEVVMRYVFNSGISWAQEATLLLSAWMVLFGVSYGIKVGSHIGVDAIVRLLPPLGRRILSGAAVLFCLIYCGLFLWGSWIYLQKMFKIGITLQDIPVTRWLAHSILLIGFLFLTVRFIQLGLSIVRGQSDGFQLANEARDAMRLSEPGHQKAEMEAGR